jgi:hypothetical protein
MSRSAPWRANVEMPYSVLGNQRGSGVVLSRERVRGAQDHVRPAGLESPDEVCRLSSDVQASGNAQADERLLALEPFADQSQNGHLALGPLDAALALAGEAKIHDVVLG